VPGVVRKTRWIFRDHERAERSRTTVLVVRGARTVGYNYIKVFHTPECQDIFSIIADSIAPAVLSLRAFTRPRSVLAG